MNNDYQELIKSLSSSLKKMHHDIPEVMQGFSNLVKVSSQDGALSKKTKELITLGIAVANRCEGCIGFHVKALIELKVTRQEILETLAVAIYMGGGPSVMYAAETLKAYEELAKRI